LQWSKLSWAKFRDILLPGWRWRPLLGELFLMIARIIEPIFGVVCFALTAVLGSGRPLEIGILFTGTPGLVGSVMKSFSSSGDIQSQSNRSTMWTDAARAIRPSGLIIRKIRSPSKPTSMPLVASSSSFFFPCV
jgi:hypothetical protein